MKSRKTVEFNERFKKHWLGYAAAAGAVGAGVLAAAPGAHADIIYTPTNTTIAPNSTVSVDLNHDGITDFQLNNFRSLVCVSHTCAGFDSFNTMHVTGAQPGNGARGFIGTMGEVFASLLAKGAPIGPGSSFQNAPYMGVATERHSVGLTYLGPWGRGGDGYLGLQFEIGGQTYYGWASLTISLEHQKGPGPYDEILTGYAYNDVANQALTAGQGQTPEPGTLVCWRSARWGSDSGGGERQSPVSSGPSAVGGDSLRCLLPSRDKPENGLSEPVQTPLNLAAWPQLGLRVLASLAQVRHRTAQFGDF